MGPFSVTGRGPKRSPLLRLEPPFDLRQSLRFGHLPARFSEREPGKYLKDYVQTYLRQEVMQEGLIRNIGSFSRFPT